MINLPYNIIMFIFGIVVGSCTLSLIHSSAKTQEVVVPIKAQPCPTCYECNHAREIYAKYIDSINYGSRKHRERYADSTRKYGQILRQSD